MQHVNSKRYDYQSKMQSEHLSKPDLFWVYNTDKKILLIDQNAANILNIEFENNGIPLEVFFEKLHWINKTRAQKFFQGEFFDNVFTEDIEITSGSYKGQLLSFLGGVVSRDNNNKMTLASGVISFNKEGNSSFFYHSVSASGSWEWDLITNTQTYSTSYYQLLDFDINDELPTDYDVWAKEFIHPEDYLEVQNYINYYIHNADSGDLFELCVRLKNKQGVYIWTIAHCTIVSRDVETKQATRIVGHNSNVNLLAKTLDQNTSEAYIDTLTSLYNRNYLNKYYSFFNSEQAMPVGCVYIDVTGLKMINDYIGHFAGDYIIKRMAEVLEYTIGHAGIIIRLSGDEFILLTIQCSQQRLKILKTALRKYAKAILDPHLYKDNAELASHLHSKHVSQDTSLSNEKIQLQNIPLLFGIGYAISGETGCKTVQDVINLADKRCQEDKQSRLEKDKLRLAKFFENTLVEKLSFLDERLANISKKDILESK